MMRIALVNMPLGPLDMPALGLSVLQRELRMAGYSARLYNLNLLYARQIGVRLYEELNTGRYDAIGEQPFADMLFPSRRNTPEFQQYITRCVSEPRYDAISRGAQNFIYTCADLLSVSNPEVVGFTLVFYQRAASLALARAIKARDPNVKIVFGGAGCESPMGEYILEQFDFLDAVFHGDADDSLIAYLERLSKGRLDHSGLFGFSYRQGREVIRLPRARRVSMSRVPAPEFDNFLDDIRLFGLRDDIVWSAPFEISRGCWWGQSHHCTFCGLNGADMEFRVKQPRQVADQLREVVQKYRPSRIAFADNIADPRLITKFIPALREHPEVGYFFEVKANIKWSELRELATLKYAAIQPGIERLNSQVLRLMRKGVSAWRCVRLLRWCAEFGIGVYWNYLFGFPGEDKSLLTHELELIGKLGHLTPPSFCAPVRLDRFSPMYREPELHGIKIGEANEAERWLFNNDKNAAFGSYSFDYEYALPEYNLTEQWTELEAAVGKWKSEYRAGTLTLRHEKEAVLILDKREPDLACEIELTGSAAEALRLCQDGVSHRALLSRRGDLVKAADELVDLGYIAVVDEMYLALPVTVNPAIEGTTGE